MTSKKVQHVFAASAAALLMALAAVGLSAGIGAPSVATPTATAVAEAVDMSVAPVTVEPAAPQGDPATSVTFLVYSTACNGFGYGDYYSSTTVSFSVGNQVVATVDPRGDCTCDPAAPKSVTVTDPAVLALFNANACTVVTMNWNSNLLIGWARAEVTRASGVQTIKIVDKTEGYSNNVCYQWEDGASYSYSSALPDADGDATPDCSDADDDNDGAADTADNCPTVANASQLDTDGDGVGDACQPALAAVPWAGSEAKPHVVYTGGKLVLQAAMVSPAGTPVGLASGSWDPGDGTGPQTINVSNSRVLEYTHTYTGADYQPYTAVVKVTDLAGKIHTDTFKVQIVPRTLDAEVTMAIDHGLWYEHKRMLPNGSWTDDHPVSSTSSTVQAFEVNGHRETGDPTKNPYVLNVKSGLSYLLTELKRLNISSQAAGDPDSNGNGYGIDLSTYRSHEPVYVLGQVIDAFIASGTPNAVITSGSEAGRTYKDLVQDMLDTYSYGQNEPGGWGEPEGGWVYFWNANDGIDSSSSAWWGVGVHAARVWGLDAPAWVIQKNADHGIPALQQAINRDPSDYYHGSCAYRAGDGGSPTQTAACLIMMSVDGFERDSPRYAGAEAFLRRNFDGGEMHGNMYAMYNLAKAMRLANDNDGSPAPITLLGGDLDWYNKDLGVNSGADGQNGFARYLVATQQPDGRWDSQGWVSGTTSTSWAILILSPALFEIGPTAVCATDSNIVCKAGAVGGCNTTGTDPYSTVNFDGSQSTAGDNPIASYSWDFGDSGSASGTSTSHQFTSTGTFNVKLTVADTKGITSSVTCPVQVVETALPPIADPGGPYAVCPTGKVVLDGSASIGRGANIISYEWDWSAPINFATVDFNGATPGDQTSVFTSQGPGTYDVALRVKDDSASAYVTTKFTTVTIKSPNDPDCVVKDRDNDGIDDPADNCPDHANADQTDTDGDGQGDACDPDDDNDGVEDGGDNCALTANADQADNDGDGQGDACDPDDDNDGFPDGDDACQFIAGVASAQGCPDADGDTVQDSADNCPTTPNTNQNDNDADGAGDACDPDDDNDTLPDDIDPRPFNPNEAPSCGTGPSIAQIWPPNHQLVPVSLVGASDVDGDALTIVVTSIFQDEPTNTQGDGNTAIDGYGVGTSTAHVRAERSGTPKVPGDGRVYHITFKVSDALTSCTKTVTVGVPHDQGQRRIPVDQGPLFKSTGGQ